MIAAPNPVGHLSIVANAVRGASVGIQFAAGTYQQTPVCALNRIDAGVGLPLDGLQHLPGNALLVGGGASQGRGRSFIGKGSPNGNLVGRIGDLYQRLDSVKGAVFFVKHAPRASRADASYSSADAAA